MVEKKVPARRSEPTALSKTPRLGEEIPRTTVPIAPPPSSERWEEGPDLTHTVRMNAVRASQLPPATLKANEARTIKGIELIVVDEHQVSGGERRAWRAAEVWTKRRVYGLDSTFRCIEILDRQTGRLEATHEILGARLGGGRMREKDKVDFSYPLPLPGMEAMFSKGKKHGYTSAVEKMIIRVRVLHTSGEDVSPSWEDIASRWSEPPPG